MAYTSHFVKFEKSDNLNNFIKYKFSYLSLLLIIALSIFYNCYYINRDVIKHDVKSYYSYLPTVFIHSDFSMSYVDDLSEAHRNMIWYETTDNLARFPKMTMGNALLYLPFFALGCLLSSFFGFPVDGFSDPFQWCLSFSSIVYFFIATLIFLRTFRHKFSDKTWAIGLLGLFLGTNFFYYLSHESAMSHIYSASLIMILISLIHKASLNKRTTLFTGMIIGLLFLIRFTNVIPVIGILIFGLQQKKWRLNDYFWPCIGVSLVLSLQLVYWKFSTGNFLVYSYQNESFFWENPKILDTLFSFRKGWFVYSPLVIFGFIGIAKIPLKNRLKLSFGVFLLIYVYVVSCWWCWWYGGSFGNRAFIDIYGLLLFPFLYLIEWISLKNGLLKTSFLILVGGLICLNLMQTHQYVHKVIHWDGMTQEAYLKTFAKFERPVGYDKMLDIPNYEEAMVGNR